MTNPHKAIRRLIHPLQVPPGDAVRLDRDHDPAFKIARLHPRSAELLERGVEMLADYQSRLAADRRYGVLVVLQALDAAGKDGTIKHVMSGVNPQGVRVWSFKVPSAVELDHDYLWRYQRLLPERGEIGIFNRSHYEEVLVVRVHRDLLSRQKLPPSATGSQVWKQRFRAINEWERYLVDNGIRVVKLFLNVSREEQRQRFLARLDTPDKNWKFSAADVRERQHWDAYQKAYSEVFSHTSTSWAPWYVIPADHKWFARVASAAVILDTLMDIDPQYPSVDEEHRALMRQAAAELEAEGPRRSVDEEPPPHAMRAVRAEAGATHADGGSAAGPRLPRPRLGVPA